MGKQVELQQPEGKQVQSWDSVGQPAIEMAKDFSKTKGSHRAEVFVLLAITFVSPAKAGETKLYFSVLRICLHRACGSGLGLSAS